jgi:hypothetical protein
MRSWLNRSVMLLVFLLVGALGCGAKSYVIIPTIGPELADHKRDREGSLKRLDQFELVCVNPPLRDPPLPEHPVALCSWMMQADQVIRANNEKARR